MASAKPNLRLPSQSQSVTALWSLPNYTVSQKKTVRIVFPTTLSNVY